MSCLISKLPQLGKKPVWLRLIASLYESRDT
jgi:hypothetical protein